MDYLAMVIDKYSASPTIRKGEIWNNLVEAKQEREAQKRNERIINQVKKNNEKEGE